jgi:ATP-binding cassette, subfamily B, bacterial
MSKVTTRAFTALIRGAWRATARERIRFWLFIFLFILAYTFDLAVPWAIGYTLDVFVKYGLTDEAMRLGTYGILAYTALRLSHSVFHHLARYIQNTVTYTARMATLTQIFSDLLKYPLRWHIGRHSGENLSKLHRSAAAVDSVIGTYIWRTLHPGYSGRGKRPDFVGCDHRDDDSL